MRRIVINNIDLMTKEEEERLRSALKACNVEYEVQRNIKDMNIFDIVDFVVDNKNIRKKQNETNTKP